MTDQSAEPTATDAAPEGEVDIRPTKPPANPDLKPPKAPDVAGDRSTFGAAASAEHFFEVYNYTIRSLQTMELSKLYTPACTFCEYTVTSIDSLREDEGSAQGGSVTLGPPEILADGIDGIEPIFFTAAQEKWRTFDSKGKLILDTDKSTRDIQVDMVWKKSRWLVNEVRVNQQ